MNLIGYLQVLSNHILAYHLFTIPWNMYIIKLFKLQVSEKKHHFSTLFLIPGMKIKFQKPHCTSTRHTQSYPRVSIDYYMKCRWSSSDKPFKTEIWKYRPSFNPRGHNENSESLLHFCKIIYMSNHILEYLLSTPENVDAVQITNFTEKTRCCH